MKFISLRTNALFFIILFNLIIFNSSCFGQNDKNDKNENQFDSHLEGQISATTNGTSLFVSIGGASIKYLFPNFNVGIMMGPALKFESVDSKIVTTPQLGIAPQIYFLKDKRFILSFPAYYIATKKIWTLSAGIGYVLTKPRK